MNEETPSDMTVQNEGEARGDETASRLPFESSAPCKCQRCGISRWYPPMMLASTALTAVFFWMYITKPVLFPVAPIPPLSPEPVIQRQEPVLEAEKAPYISSRNPLDPGASALPGESEDQTVLPDQEHTSEDKLRPLIIKRNGPSLFRPFTPAASPDRAAEEADPGIRESAAVSDKGAERADGSPRKGRRLDSGDETTRRWDSGDLHVHASIMGEFLVSKRLEGTNHAVER